MSDNADRSVFNGGTGSVPHKDFDGRESASTSTPSEDYSDLFDYDAYYDRVGTDVTTAPSAGKLANGSSILTQATTPVASHSEDTPMQDALVQEPQLSNVWPKVSDPPPSRDTNISLEASLSPQAPGEMHLEKQTQFPSASGQKVVTRVIKDLDETNKVRELGACYHCKMNRKACNSGSVCEECSKRYEKPSSAERACIRTPLKDLVPPKIGRWNWVDPSRIMPTRDRFMSDEADRLFVSCSESGNGPYLELRVGRFALADKRDHGVHGVHRFGIKPDSLPLDDAMYHWMEQHILVQNRSGFEAELDKLLLGLVSQPRANMQQWPHQLPEQLLLNLFKMRCLCKIWSSKQLFFWRADGQLLPPDMRFASIQDSLRLLAGRTISELERKVIEDLGKFLERKETKEMRPATALLKCK
ncbi:hypothetical protein C7999DRAFT_10424 [Corynascus novoguineensis]|uniref:Uncharacterized protein n=1 Tax=Corynascus novoguineensis TaxID=1126955 RepID=A0AAN7HUR4_9PEZI|nr:hypothetical protein C7999DRAFT_10424 [Corynascus novoguineensis]